MLPDLNVGRGSSQPPPEDRKRIEHILRCARDAQRIVGDETAELVGKDMIRSRALVNCFAELGEAAARLTPEGRARTSNVPWSKVVGMRHIIVHVYWGIDLNELVQTVRADLPTLIVTIETALRDWPNTTP
ncbi:MAG: DUF86 domain-containing protein [Phycisphaerales bacterium]|nr:DUF86 domain-containing protein [Phycisphaerales bacterium]